MPSEPEYSLQDLADLADVTPRTVRFYVAQGILPSPGRVGPGAIYGPGHLARLKLIRRLQREHLPLAEIRARLAGLADGAVQALVDAPTAPSPAGSASDYIRNVLGESLQRHAAAPAMRAFAPQPLIAPGPVPPLSPFEPRIEPPAPDRSQWDRIVLVPDVELHVRRPLTRHLNKRVDRLIAIARELLEEDPS